MEVTLNIEERQTLPVLIGIFIHNLIRKLYYYYNIYFNRKLINYHY